MRTKVVSVFFLGFYITTTSLQAFSIGGWNPVDSAKKLIVAPIATLRNAVQVVTGDKPPSSLLDPTKDAAKSVAPAVQLATDVVTWPQQKVFQATQSLGTKIGPLGEVIVDVATFTERYTNSIIQSGGADLASTLAGHNPLDIVAIPLAAAIHEARDRHYPNSHPLPPDVQSALSHFFTPSVLQRARYTVGSVEITLPNGIGKIHKYFGDDIAVVCDDVIVFPTDPGSFNHDPQWWGHEVTHIKQFAELGVEEFAFRYVRSFSHEIEDPAYANGDAVLAWAKSNPAVLGSATPPLVITRAHVQADVQTSPLAPQPIVDLVQEAAAASTTPATASSAAPNVQDRVVIRCIFPNDPYQYFGTSTGRILVFDPSNGAWMQIGWAAPPDISGPAWVYLIPGRVAYDVFPGGQIVQRFGPPNPMDPLHRPGPPIQVGWVVALKVP